MATILSGRGSEDENTAGVPRRLVEAVRELALREHDAFGDVRFVPTRLVPWIVG